MKKRMLFSCLIGIILFSGCDKDEETPQSSTVSGSAVKGYVDAAKVDVYEYLSSGNRGKLLTSTSTDSRGNYQFSVDYRGPVEIVVSEGSYIDESTGTTVNLGSSELRSIAFLKEGNQKTAVSTLTSIAAEYVKVNATSNIEASIDDANAKIAQEFGLTGIDISKEAPADLSYPVNGFTTAQVQYGAIQAGLSQVVKDKGIAPDQLLTLIEDFSKDFSDEMLDGKYGSVALQISLTLTPFEAMDGLGIAIETFLQSDRNLSGYTSESIGLILPATRTGG